MVNLMLKRNVDFTLGRMVNLMLKRNVDFTLGRMVNLMLKRNLDFTLRRMTFMTFLEPLLKVFKNRISVILSLTYLWPFIKVSAAFTALENFIRMTR
jgi:hypothetical protein